jgi:hypothetical protein
VGGYVCFDVSGEQFASIFTGRLFIGQVDAKVIGKAKCVECIGRPRLQRLRLGTLMMEAGCSSEML